MSESPSSDVQTATDLSKLVGDAVVDSVKRHPYWWGFAGAYALGKATKALKKKYIAANTFLELDLNTTTFQFNSLSPMGRAMAPGVENMRHVINTIKLAANDSRIRGLLVRLGSVKMNLADAEELREAVAEFGRADNGKRTTIAYAESFGEGSNGLLSYYVGSVFKELYLAPCGDVGIVDFAAEVPFLKSMLEKIGFEPRLFSRKQYKNAKNMFTEKKFDEYHKEATEGILKSIRAHLIAGMASGRNIEEKTMEGLLGTGPHMAKEALENRLVDGLLYKEGVKQRIADIVGIQGDDRAKKISMLFLHLYASKRRAAPFAAVPYSKGHGKTSVAYINLGGNIHTGASEREWTGVASSIGSDDACSAIRAATADKKVKAILLHVDSRGGSYVASDHIAHCVLEAKKAGKKVVVSMSSVAGSGGYFISLHADKIVCNPVTITGSIGVVFGKFLTQEFWSHIGIDWDHIDLGPNSRAMSGLKEFSEADTEKINLFLDRIYDDFTAQAAAGRRMSREDIEAVAKGRIWTGIDALRHGLVDKLGGLETAIDVVKSELHLKDGQEVHLQVFPKPPSLMSLIDGSRQQHSDDFARATSYGGMRFGPGISSMSLPFQGHSGCFDSGLVTVGQWLMSLRGFGALAASTSSTPLESLSAARQLADGLGVRLAGSSASGTLAAQVLHVSLLTPSSAFALPQFV